MNDVFKVRGAIDPGLHGAVAVTLAGPRPEAQWVYDRLLAAGFMKPAAAQQCPSLIVIDTPTRTRDTGKKLPAGKVKLKTEYRPARMLEFLQCFRPPSTAVWDVAWAIEALGNRGRAATDQSTHGQVQGIGWGVWWMGLVACEFEMEIAWASAWKAQVFRDHPEFPRALPIPKTLTGKALTQAMAERYKQAKLNARGLAKKLFPGSAELFKLAKHDGRADAALLAVWLDQRRAGLWLGGAPSAAEVDAAPFLPGAA